MWASSDAVEPKATLLISRSHPIRTRDFDQCVSDGFRGQTVKHGSANCAKRQLRYRLRRREGFMVNRKRIQRVYRAAGLSVRRRPRKRVAMERVPKPAVTLANRRWSMDFVSDALADGRRFRSLTLGRYVFLDSA